MKVQKFFDDQAEASDSDDEEYDSAEDSPGSLAEFIVDDLESKSEVRSLNSLLDSVSSDSLSVKKRKKDHNSDSSSSEDESIERKVKRKRGRPLGSKNPKVIAKKNVLPTKKASKSNDSKGRAKGK